MQTQEITYSTKFTLEAPVIDFEAAREYLVSDDMIRYLPDYFHGLVTSVEWLLRTEDSGVIVVKTTKELTAEQSKELSDWISGQCSDGLGEGFEQQEFASYEAEREDCYCEDDADENGEWECYCEDPGYVTASFDYYSNQYLLTGEAETPAIGSITVEISPTGETIYGETDRAETVVAEAKEAMSTKDGPRYDIEVALTGVNGNAFNLIGIVARALRDEGVEKEEIDKFHDKAMSEDYNNVLSTIMKWVHVA